MPYAANLEQLALPQAEDIVRPPRPSATAASDQGGAPLKAGAPSGDTPDADQDPDAGPVADHDRGQPRQVAEERGRRGQVRRRHRRDRDRQGDHGGRGGRRGHARQDPGAGRHRGREGQRADRAPAEEGEDAVGARRRPARSRRRKPDAKASAGAPAPAPEAGTGTRAGKRQRRPGTRRSGTAADGERIFASPLARRMARAGRPRSDPDPGQRPARPDRQGRHRGAWPAAPPRSAPAGCRGRPKTEAAKPAASQAAARRRRSRRQPSRRPEPAGVDARLLDQARHQVPRIPNSHAQGDRAPPDRGQADHPALLPDHRLRARRAPEDCAAELNGRDGGGRTSFGQRLRHQGGGAGAAQGAGGQRRLGRRRDLPVQGRRHLGRGRDPTGLITPIVRKADQGPGRRSPTR